MKSIQTNTISNTINSPTPKKEEIFDPNPQTDCFVGGLPINASEEEIREFFEQEFPQVNILNIHLVKKKKHKKRNKGFGFVSLSSQKDALSFLGLSTVFRGKKLDIRRATRYKEQQEKMEEFFSTRVFVDELDLAATDDCLRKVFEKEFQVTRCYIIKDHQTEVSKGLGFVDFGSQEEAQRCLARNNFQLAGKPIKVAAFNIQKKVKAVKEKKEKNVISIESRDSDEKKIDKTQMNDFRTQESALKILKRQDKKQKPGVTVRHPLFSFCSESEFAERKQRNKEYLLVSQRSKLNEAVMNYRLKKWMKNPRSRRAYIPNIEGMYYPYI